MSDVMSSVMCKGGGKDVNSVNIQPLGIENLKQTGTAPMADYVRRSSRGRSTQSTQREQTQTEYTGASGRSSEFDSDLTIEFDLPLRD